jgi:hypothetical protein
MHSEEQIEEEFRALAWRVILHRKIHKALRSWKVRKLEEDPEFLRKVKR